mmetsp:Transcript_34324/g.45395  ORF Transcript_34324/g.45395 Transcript_34324/m.45395 type:complete len:81 (-) Transcript_34324:525-767(-)
MSVDISKSFSSLPSMSKTDTLGILVVFIVIYAANEAGSKILPFALRTKRSKWMTQQNLPGIIHSDLRSIVCDCLMTLARA